MIVFVMICRSSKSQRITKNSKFHFDQSRVGKISKKEIENLVSIWILGKPAEKAVPNELILYLLATPTRKKSESKSKTIEREGFERKINESGNLVKSSRKWFCSNLGHCQYFAKSVWNRDFLNPSKVSSILSSHPDINHGMKKGLHDYPFGLLDSSAAVHLA